MIRACYNKRADNPEYHRLTFALMGVAAPSDLIQNKQRTPFNIGQAIRLTGFQLYEAHPLTRGFVGKVNNPEVILEQVLKWTGGQPFLTQKVCGLIAQKQGWETIARTPESNLIDKLARWREGTWELVDRIPEPSSIDKLIRSSIIENWEAQDEPEHLKTIRDRLLQNEQRAGRLLGLYQQILQQGEIPANDSLDQVLLRLTGLVVEQEGKLKVYNQIYSVVFSNDWVNQSLADLRPYAEALTAWLESDCTDESRLLQGKTLEAAQAWAKDKNLPWEDGRFLSESEQYANREIARKLEAQEKANQIVQRARQSAEQTLAAEQAANQRLQKTQRKTRRVLWVGAVGLIGMVILAVIVVTTSQAKLQDVGLAIDWERRGVEAQKQFENDQLGALLTAMQIGREMQAEVHDGRSLNNYPTLTPVLALHTILSNIQENNRFSFSSGNWSFSPNGKLIAVEEEGIVRLWNWSERQLTEFKVVKRAYEESLESISFSPDSKLIATVSEESKSMVRLWNLAGQKLMEIRMGKSPEINFSSDSKVIAIAEGNMVQLWNLVGQKLAEFKVDQPSEIDFSPDGKVIAINEEGIIRLRNLDGQQLAEFRTEGEYVTIDAFSPNGKVIAIRVDPIKDLGKIWLWNWSKQQFAELKVDQGDSSVSFSSNDKLIATIEKHKVRLWSWLGEQVAELKGFYNGIEFSPDNKHLVTFGNDFGLWDISDLENISLQWTVKPQIAKFDDENEPYIRYISFSSDGTQIATTGGFRNTVQIWSLLGRQLAEFKLEQYYDALVKDVEFSPDSNQIATVRNDGIRLWNLWRSQIWRSQHHFSIGDLDQLLAHGCTWLSDYLATHPNVPKICPGQDQYSRSSARFVKSRTFYGCGAIYSTISFVGFMIASRKFGTTGIYTWWITITVLQLVILTVSSKLTLTAVTTMNLFVRSSTLALGALLLIQSKHQQHSTEIEAPQALKPTVSSLPKLNRFEFETATLVRVRRGLLGFNVIWEVKYKPGEAEYFSEDLGNGIMLDMVKVPGGQFLMGSPDKESRDYYKEGRVYFYESPQHLVLVPPFFMGKFAVTNAQYEAIIGKTPAAFKGANLPVDRLSWYDAVEFCDRLSQKTGRIYRLPSEAEWEYACRAGTATTFHFGDKITTDLANFNGDHYLKDTFGLTPRGEYGRKPREPEKPTEVGSFPPNAFGLYDMHGNVWEWCQDLWHENYDGAPIDGSAWTTGGEDVITITREIIRTRRGVYANTFQDQRRKYGCQRGGSWNLPTYTCRSAHRCLVPLSVSTISAGFRVVLVVA